MVDKSYIYNITKDNRDIGLSFKYFYGAKCTDDMMLRDNGSKPRFGYLARKAMAHYAGALYVPHRTGFYIELNYRDYIEDFIKEKIFNRAKEYDWVFIDNFFKRRTNELFDTQLTYDKEMFERGYSTPDFKRDPANSLAI